MYGKKVVCVPHHVTPEYDYSDPDFGDNDIQTRAKKQGALLQHFWTRWRQQYLTGLREFYQTSGSNIQTVKPGAIVLVHDNTPRLYWHLAVVEDTISGADGLIRAANIRTSTGRTNRPITKLHLLEITTAESDTLCKQNSSPKENPSNSDAQSSTVEQTDDISICIPERNQPVRQVALRGRLQGGPPEDVIN